MSRLFLMSSHGNVPVLQIRPSITPAFKVCLLHGLQERALFLTQQLSDFRLHIYDTSQPPSFEVPAGPHEDQTTMKEMKTINAVPGNWTITDSHLSPDNERMIYSSMVSNIVAEAEDRSSALRLNQTTTVHMTKTRDPGGEQTPIPLADGPRREYWNYPYADNFAIYACRFSADGNEIIAGGSGKIFGAPVCTIFEAKLH